MKRLLTLVAFFATLQASAQQVNPVPDYVFANRMSAGRNTVTDTAAYFSIGPRYGATRGMMPPMVVDTASFSANKRNGLLIFSVQKNKFLYWDSVRVQWSDMAGSSGSYITGTLTNNYIPKATSTTTLGNSVMYDSSGHVRVYGNYVGNTNPNRLLFTSEISGNNGYTALFKQSDSITDAGQFPLILRKGLLTTDKPRPNFGVGLETQLQDDAGTWRRSGFVVNRIVDSTAANFRTKFDFRLINGSTYPIPLIVSGDSSIRMAKLAGSGTRYVVADANGDISASSATALVDTTTISTRAWRQKGLDSLAALEVSGSGTTNYVPKFTAGSTIGNSQIFDNGTSVGVGTASPNASMRLHVSGQTRIDVDSGQAMLTGVVPAFGQVFTQTIDKNGDTRINTNRHLIFRTSDVSERLRITSGGNVGIGDASPTDLLVVNGRMRVNGTNRITFGNNSGGYAGIGVTGATTGNLTFNTFDGTSDGERLRIFANGRVGINTTTDAGYQLDVNGTLRSVNGANFATTSGNVGIGTASPSSKLDVVENAVAINQLRVGQDAVHKVMIGAETNFAEIQAIRVGVDFNKPLVLQRQGGNVGIGTASPSGKLTVVGASSNTYISIDNAGSGENYYASNSFQQWQTSGSARMTLNSAGELLINTTSDAGDYKLQVSGSSRLYHPTANIGGLLTSFNGNSENYYDADLHTFRFGNGGGPAMVIRSNAEVAINNPADAGDYKLQVAGNIYNTGSAVLAATSGQVGIGTSSPVTKLHISGAGSTSARIQATGASGSALIDFIPATQTNPWYLYVNESRNMIFQDNASERGRINSAGEWIIDASGTDAGNYKLQVSGQAFIRNTATSGALYLDSTSLSIYEVKNRHAILISGHSLTGAEIQGPIYVGTNWNTSSDVSAIEVALTNTASGANSNLMKLSDGTNTFRVTKDAGIFTAAPSGGTARKWKLGSVVATTVILDTANYVEVEINGVAYKLALVTPN